LPGAVPPGPHAHTACTTWMAATDAADGRPPVFILIFCARPRLDKPLVTGLNDSVLPPTNCSLYLQLRTAFSQPAQQHPFAVRHTVFFYRDTFIACGFATLAWFFTVVHARSRTGLRLLVQQPVAGSGRTRGRRYAHVDIAVLPFGGFGFGSSGTGPLVLVGALRTEDAYCLTTDMVVLHFTERCWWTCATLRAPAPLQYTHW